MKNRLIIVKICMVLVAVLALAAYTLPAFAVTSTAPGSGSITVTNNLTGIPDTVKVTGLNAGDVIKIYSSSAGVIPIGGATAASGSVTASIYQLGTTAGVVYVTVTSGGKQESSRTLKSYSAEPMTPSIPAGDITIVNRAGTGDTITVDNVLPGDVIKVYNSQASLIPIGGVTAVDTSATVSIYQLGSGGGNLYTCRSRLGALESVRTQKAYTSEISIAPLASEITVTNNFGETPDEIKVNGLAKGDVVRVFSGYQGDNLLGTAAATDTSATVSVNQLGTTGGTVYVSVIRANKSESARTARTYSMEPTSIAPSPANISVVNNYVGEADTVTVKGLAAGDFVKVYNAATAGTLLGGATAANGQATVTIDQLGTTAGSVYVTVTGTDKLESARTLKSYTVEPTTTALLSSNITVVNNYMLTPDTVTVKVAVNDVVKVYNAATGGTLLGTERAETETVVVTINQLGIKAGSIYVTVTSPNKIESSRTSKSYPDEPTSTPAKAANVTVTNNFTNTPDKVVVSGLAEGDEVRVYNAMTGGTQLGMAKCVGSTATVTIDQLGTAGGTVYVSVTSDNKQESPRISKEYTGEPVSTAPTTSSITVKNNIVKNPDTITVTGLSQNDVVKVYSAQTGGTLLGTVSADTATAVVSVEQLGMKAGSVYVSVSNDGKLESARTGKAYAAEPASQAPASGDITVTNNLEGIPDTIEVGGLKQGDIVKVYAASTGSDPIGDEISEGTSVIVSVYQLGKKEGNVYVTVTNPDQVESGRIAKSYAGEPTSAAPQSGNVAVNNNIEGRFDTIAVSHLGSGDIVKVYTSKTATVPAGGAVATGAAATVSVYQLGKAAGTVYVSVTNPGIGESPRTEVKYLAEPNAPASTAPAAGNITVVNSPAGTQDTITVAGVTSGDVVRVYANEDSTQLLAEATAAGNSVTISIDQLGVEEGVIYVSVSSAGKLESVFTAKAYNAEQ